MRITFAAGGTGGHIVPALAVAEAVAEELSQRSELSELVFIGTGREIERKLIEPAGYQLFAIPAQPIRGKGISGYLRFLAQLPIALFRLVYLYTSKRPAVVVGFGGYPAFLPLLTAALFRIPTVLQEQNAEMGLANRLLSRIATRVFVPPDNRKQIKHTSWITLPNPVRRRFSDVARWQRPASAEQLTLVIVGGSQGAVTLNHAVVEALREITKTVRLKIIHQTGAKDYDIMVSRYRELSIDCELTPFVEDLSRLYARSHLIVSRAGAMSVAEITAAGRPAVYVPLAIAGGHQRANVEQVVAAGAAQVVLQNAHLVENLASTLSRLLSDPGELERMADAARKAGQGGEVRPATEIARRILQLARA